MFFSICHVAKLDIVEETEDMRCGVYLFKFIYSGTCTWPTYWLSVLSSTSRFQIEDVIN